MWRYLVYSLRIRRVEYRIAELPIFLIPVTLTIGGGSELLSQQLWVGAFIFFFLFAFGDILNCLADRELDAIYKPHLTEAVMGIGIRGVIGQAVFSAIAALALSVYLAWLLARWILVPATMFGLVLAWAYSVAPVRLKGRGLWQLAFYWLGLFTGPMIFVELLFRPVPAWPNVWVYAAFGLTQTGAILLNTAEDFIEDRSLGVRTAIVTLGLQAGMRLAFCLTAIGGIALVTPLAAWCVDAHPFWGAIGVAPLILAVTANSYVFARLAIQLRGAKDDEAAANMIKRVAGYAPILITATALSTLVAAICQASQGS